MFFRLDIKTYPIKFSLKMFICRGYNGRGANDVSVICNGWNIHERKWLVVECNALR